MYVCMCVCGTFECCCCCCCCCCYIETTWFSCSLPRRLLEKRSCDFRLQPRKSPIVPNTNSGYTTQFSRYVDYCFYRDFPLGDEASIIHISRCLLLVRGGQYSEHIIWINLSWQEVFGAVRSQHCLAAHLRNWLSFRPESYHCACRTIVVVYSSK